MPSVEPFKSIRFLSFAVVVLSLFNSGCNLFKPANLLTGESDQASLQSSAKLEAFRNSVYHITRNNCVKCHGANQQPTHAVDNISVAYNAGKTRVNFSSPESSVIVIKTQDGHCGVKCQTSGSQMTDAVAKWAQAELSDSIPVLRAASDSKLRLGTRHFVSSKLENIFGVESRSIIQPKITDQISIFGGPCDRYGADARSPYRSQFVGNCDEAFNSQAPSVPLANSARMAMTIRTCDLILQSDSSLIRAAKLIVGSNSDPTGVQPNDLDIQSSFKYFYSDGLTPLNVLTSLKAVVSTAKAQTYPAIESWRFLLLTLCMSPDWQIP